MEKFTEKEQSFIRYVLDDRPNLEPVFTSPGCIPERLKEIDHNCFIVFNHSNNKFELHSLESFMPDIEKITTFQMNLPELSSEVIEKVILSSHIYRGHEIHEFIHDSQETYEKSIGQIHKQKMQRSVKSTVDAMMGKKKVY